MVTALIFEYPVLAYCPFRFLPLSHAPQLGIASTMTHSIFWLRDVLIEMNQLFLYEIWPRVNKQGWMMRKIVTLNHSKSLRGFILSLLLPELLQRQMHCAGSYSPYNRQVTDTEEEETSDSHMQDPMCPDDLNNGNVKPPPPRVSQFLWR